MKRMKRKKRRSRKRRNDGVLVSDPEDVFGEHQDDIDAVLELTV